MDFVSKKVVTIVAPVLVGMSLAPVAMAGSVQIVGIENVLISNTILSGSSAIATATTFTSIYEMGGGADAFYTEPFHLPPGVGEYFAPTPDDGGDYFDQGSAIPVAFSPADPTAFGFGNADFGTFAAASLVADNYASFNGMDYRQFILAGTFTLGTDYSGNYFNAPSDDAWFTLTYGQPTGDSNPSDVSGSGELAVPAPSISAVCLVFAGGMVVLDVVKKRRQVA